MTKRKFYKTIYQVTVLSEESVDFNGLADIAYAITEGDCSGIQAVVSSEVINGEQAVKELKGQSSSPEFFMLDDNGNDL